MITNKPTWQHSMQDSLASDRITSALQDAIIDIFYNVEHHSLIEYTASSHTNMCTIVCTRTYFSIQCESNKSPPCGFLTFSPNSWKFLINFYTPIIRYYLRQITNSYSIISNFDEVMPY